MKKTMKIAGIVVAVLVAAFAGIAALAKVVITPERVRNTVIPLAEKKLHRQVHLGEIEVHIFSGIVVKGLEIMEKDGGAAFVKADMVKLRYQFWPLLTRRIVVDEVRLDAPRIRVVRMADGSFNYSDIMTPKESSPPAKAEGKGEVNLLVSKVALAKGELQFEDRSGKLGNPFDYRISGIEFSAKDISLDKPFPFNAKAALPGATLELEGKASKQAIDVVLKVAVADLKAMIAALPAGITAKAKAYDPGGAVNVSLHLAGPVAKPKELLKDGEVRLENVQVAAAGQRPVLAGKLVLKGDAVSSDNLVLSMGPNKMQIRLAIAHLMARPISITSELKADRFDMTPFQAKKESAAPAKGKGAAVPASAAKPEPGPLNLPVHATGTVQVGQTNYKGLAISGFLLKYRLIDNILTIDQLSGNAAGGSFSDTARIDLRHKGFAYSTRLIVKGVQADQFLAAFAPKAANTVFGTLALDADLNGSGTQPATYNKTLNGQGSFSLSQGRLTGPGLVQQLALFLNLEQLRTIHFDTFAGTFRMEKGKARIDSGIKGRDVQFTPKGTAGLDKSIDMSLATRLSPELTGKVAKGEVGRFLTDDKGWGLLPLKVRGTTSAPRFGLDTTMIGEQLKTKTREKLQQTIEEKLLKKKGGESRQPGGNLIEKGLKGIFGK